MINNYYNETNGKWISNQMEYQSEKKIKNKRKEKREKRKAKIEKRENRNAKDIQIYYMINELIQSKESQERRNQNTKLNYNPTQTKVKPKKLNGIIKCEWSQGIKIENRKFISFVSW